MIKISFDFHFMQIMSTYKDNNVRRVYDGNENRVHRENLSFKDSNKKPSIRHMGQVQIDRIDV